jgi:hypothetical protein
MGMDISVLALWIMWNRGDTRATVVSGGAFAKFEFENLNVTYEREIVVRARRIEERCVGG